MQQRSHMFPILALDRLEYPLGLIHAVSLPNRITSRTARRGRITGVTDPIAQGYRAEVS